MGSNGIGRRDDDENKQSDFSDLSTMKTSFRVITRCSLHGNYYYFFSFYDTKKIFLYFNVSFSFVFLF